ncbi:MAG: hypothetical protein ACR2RE_26995, partial [Geminicoccaceae bacterium]
MPEPQRYPEIYSSRDVYEGHFGGERSTKMSGKLLKLLKSDNIAEDLPAEMLARIGDRVVKEYTIDKGSRAEWEANCDKAMKLAMQIAKAKHYPWPKASNVKFPLLTVAAIQFAARAYPAMISGADIVKPKVLGNDKGVPQMGPDGQPALGPEGEQQWQVEPGAKRARGERVARHQSWQLLYEMIEWEEETDK